MFPYIKANLNNSLQGFYRFLQPPPDISLNGLSGPGASYEIDELTGMRMFIYYQHMPFYLKRNLNFLLLENKDIYLNLFINGIILMLLELKSQIG